MVVPIYPYINKADRVAEELGNQVDQGIPIVALGNFEFEHHDGNYDG
ncbi:hypothetical protein Back11_62110 [Paenibacillus baekrokdamisoli]|uniref:Uncharacterized protein n=1 Tax=Paenibacillus baekrokdamisoli TaxID=1712516 RepID=A0A3G9J278_9BACL|nr:hypothetical protein Back11_62110 [Paenibacillus baekrokdamisoli]